MFRGRWVTWQPAPLRSGPPCGAKSAHRLFWTIEPCPLHLATSHGWSSCDDIRDHINAHVASREHHLREAGITLLRQFVFRSLLGASTDVVLVVVLLISDRLLFLCQPALGSRTRLRSRTLGAVKSTFGRPSIRAPETCGVVV